MVDDKDDFFPMERESVCVSESERGRGKENLRGSNLKSCLTEIEVKMCFSLIMEKGMKISSL